MHCETHLSSSHLLNVLRSQRKCTTKTEKINAWRNTFQKPSSGGCAQKSAQMNKETRISVIDWLKNHLQKRKLHPTRNVWTLLSWELTAGRWESFQDHNCLLLVIGYYNVIFPSSICHQFACIFTKRNWFSEKERKKKDYISWTNAFQNHIKILIFVAKLYR